MLLSLLLLPDVAGCLSTAPPPPPPPPTPATGGFSPPGQTSPGLSLWSLQFGGIRLPAGHIPPSLPFLPPKKTHNIHIFLAAKITRLSKSIFLQDSWSSSWQDEIRFSWNFHGILSVFLWQLLPSSALHYSYPFTLLLMSLQAPQEKDGLTIFTLPRAIVN